MKAGLEASMSATSSRSLTRPALTRLSLSSYLLLARSGYRIVKLYGSSPLLELSAPPFSRDVPGVLAHLWMPANQASD